MQHVCPLAGAHFCTLQVEPFWDPRRSPLLKRRAVEALKATQGAKIRMMAVVVTATEKMAFCS